MDMDTAFSQRSRWQARSSTNINHLSLAPLTTRLPLTDHDNLPDSFTDIPPPPHTSSYLEGRSAPATPSLFYHSPSRSRETSTSRSRAARSTAAASSHLPKSRSATHLSTSTHARRNHHGSRTPGTLSPPTAAGSRRRHGDSLDLSLTATAVSESRSGSDWVVRAGTLIANETRESKGQAWLATRASATSLTGALRDAEEEAAERELARERWEEHAARSRGASRRGSLAPGTAGSGGSGVSSPSSRFGSRAGSRTQLAAAAGEPYGGRRSGDDYFPDEAGVYDGIPGPDFVNLDERLEAMGLAEEVEVSDDEDHVRRLAKRESTGFGSWIGNALGLPLFSVQENEEEEGSTGAEADDAEADESGWGDDARQGRRSTFRQFEGISHDRSEETIPPPKGDEGGWRDAAWLLSVASKVIL